MIRSTRPARLDMIDLQMPATAADFPRDRVLVLAAFLRLKDGFTDWLRDGFRGF